MIIAVDTGGTKTLVARFSKRGILEKDERFETPKDFQQYLDLLIATIEQMTHDETINALCVALPGEISDGSTVSHTLNIGWPNGINVKSLLTARFSCPIFLENDANLAGLAEVRHLAKVPRVGLYITISTGIGTGLVIDGMLRPEWTISEGGQIMLERDGRFASWESFASGKAIHERYKMYARDIKNPRVWNDIAKDISRGILVLAPVIRPDVIIIGGSIGTYFDQYAPQLEGLLKEHLRPQYVPRLLRAEHPEQAVIYGCYLYATEHLTS